MHWGQEEHLHQRQKFVGSEGALLPGKFLRVRKVFARGTYFFYIITKTCLESLRIVWKCFNIMGKESGLSGKFPDCLESFRIVWKVSGLTGIVWKVSRLSGNFPDCLETLQIVWKGNGLSGKFSDCLESFLFV